MNDDINKLKNIMFEWFLKNNLDLRLKEIHSHGKYILGPEVFELEQNLSDYLGVKYAITCANGTDALTLSLMSLVITAGDAVIIPSFSFVFSRFFLPILRVNLSSDSAKPPFGSK